MSDYGFHCACSLCAGGPTLHAGDAVTGSASAAKPSLSLAQIQSQLRTQWGGSQEGHTWTWLGTSTVSYSINASVTGVSEAAGLVQMTALMQDRARLAFELWDDVIALSLNESTNNPNANITFNYSSQTKAVAHTPIGTAITPAAISASPAPMSGSIRFGSRYLPSLPPTDVFL